MGLPEDYYVELQSSSAWNGSFRKPTSKLFQAMGEDRIEITIRKPGQDDSSFMNYLVAEIENAVDRYEPKE